LYRKWFSFYRKVMTIKITGLAIKRLPHNAVAKETFACSLGETSRCDAWRDKQTDGPSIKLYFETISFIVQNVLRVSPFPKPSFSYKIILKWGGGLSTQTYRC